MFNYKISTFEYLEILKPSLALLFFVKHNPNDYLKMTSSLKFSSFSIARIKKNIPNWL